MLTLETPQAAVFSILIVLICVVMTLLATFLCVAALIVVGRQSVRIRTRRQTIDVMAEPHGDAPKIPGG